MPDSRERKARGAVDDEFRGAFPGGPSPLPTSVARKILRDPKAMAAQIARNIRHRRAGAQEIATNMRDDAAEGIMIDLRDQDKRG